MNMHQHVPQVITHSSTYEPNVYELESHQVECIFHFRQPVNLYIGQTTTVLCERFTCHLSDQSTIRNNLNKRILLEILICKILVKNTAGLG